MNPEEQEAESRKYSNDVIILLPLSTGAYAVFNAARQLQYIEFIQTKFSVKPPETSVRKFHDPVLNTIAANLDLDI